jgi:hypothetical protein
MRLDITFSVGYERRRAGGADIDRWEARGTTAGLLLAGVAVTVLVLYLISRLLSGL